MTLPDSVRLAGARGRLAALAVVLLAGCAGADAADAVFQVRAEPVTLGGGRTELPETGRLRFLTGYRLTSADHRFGGFSGLWLAADGSRLIAASDAGTLWQATLEHDPGGRLESFGAFEVVTPAMGPGDPRHPKDQNIEALAPDGNGGLVLAYEGTHRLRRAPLDQLDASPARLPTPPELDRHGNSGMEALAGLADGTLLAFSEGENGPDGTFPAWRIGVAGSELLSYRGAPGFAPTGADRLDDAIFVLERRFSWLGGFQSRITRLPAASVAPGVLLEGEELAVLRPPLRTENFEALAVRRTPDGRVLLYIVSDDNFIMLQSTLLLQFELVP